MWNFWNIYNIYLQLTDIKGTTLWSAKEDDAYVDPPDNLSRNLLVNNKTKAHLLNQFLKSYFFRNMAYVSNTSPLQKYTNKYFIQRYAGNYARYPCYPNDNCTVYYRVIRNSIHFLQMPLNKANCGILAVLAQLRDVPADYLPIYFRYSFLIFFCETYKEYQVRVLHFNPIRNWDQQTLNKNYK